MLEKSVFIITSGCYSDYRIVGVYDTEEKAEQIVKTLREGRIEKHPLNPFLTELNSGLSIYSVQTNRNGDTIRVERKPAEPDNWAYAYDLESTLEPLLTWKQDGKIIYGKYVFARDEAHAVKIVNELRVQKLATGR